MVGDLEEKDVLRQQRDQMLKLVTKGFYHELTSFGVETKEVLRVASHLLDNLLSEKEPSGNGIPYHNGFLKVEAVQDDWAGSETITVQDVMLRPIQPSTVGLVAGWLEDRGIRESFVPAFPEAEGELRGHFSAPTCRYFEVVHAGETVGIVGGEDVDESAGKLAMKKLVGEARMQGKGIGKRATFGFLYYAFMILGMNKVYIHSRDINIRNINLNSRFGFELEGIFYEDLLVDGKRRDVVRMALLKRSWLEIFSSKE
jgi:RimJ/RimL family protein N-acetyltransferase